jgi:hypothetical protein
MSDRLELQISINTDRIESIIRKSKDLQNDERVFSELSWLMDNKKAVDQMNEEWEVFERKIKQALNDKAKDLLGPEWKALDGDGFSLRRSMTGSVYQLTDPDKVDDKLLEVKLSVKTKEVENYIKANSKLPVGLSYNPNRNEQIRIKLT